MMHPTDISAQPHGHTMNESSPRDWLTMTKPGVLLLVVFSAATGMLMAPTQLHPFLQLLTLAAIAMGSASGAIFNMLYDQDIDRHMKRTQHRPLVTGVIHADDATMLAIVLAIFSVSLLGLATNWYAATLLAFAIFFYAGIYTIGLKRHTPQNIVIGGAAGAFPPVIGWLAMTGDVTLMPWVLFAIIFCWTPPHFWALALFRNADYRTVNVPMLPTVSGPITTTRHMLAYTILLLPLCLVPLLLDARLGWLYATAATLLNGRFILHAWQLHRTQSESRTMPMFGFSIIYLFAIFGVMLIDGYWV